VAETGYRRYPETTLRAEKFQYPGFDLGDMERSHALSIGLAVVIVAGVVAPPVTASSGASGYSLQQSVDPDLVNLNVALQENGDARWQIEYFVRLSTDNETQAFEDLMADVEANRSAYIDRFAQRMNATVASAAESTGREMRATDFTVSTEIRTLGNQYGVLTYTFTWTNFAQVSDDTITAGDALDGFFLDEETSLQFAWPDAYGLQSVSPDPDSIREQSVTWRGPLDFATGEPTLSVAPGATGPTTTDGGETPTQTTPSQESGGIWGWLIGGFVVLALVGAGVWYWRQQGEAPSPAAETEGGDEPPEEPPAELLSNEERVEQYLENHGGRAKQQEIVDGLGWTEAKTSQVLSDMQDADRIEKFRIGRENVVKLPDTDGKTE
jgi:uncharacterized membrane protein